MDQIGLALSRRKLPRKPFSRRVCLAGCALDSCLRPRPCIPGVPSVLSVSFPTYLFPLPPHLPLPPLRPFRPPPCVIILLLRNILETPVGLAKPL